MNEFKDMVGREVELIDGKKVTIANFKEINGTTIFTSTDGEIFSEDDVNWYIKVTPQYLLFTVLEKHEIVWKDEWDCEKYTAIFEDFMSEMERCGYIAKTDGDDE